MKPYRSETVRLFNLLYYARPFFWYGLPIQVSVNGNCVRLVKSGKLIHTMAPLALSFVNTIVLGLGIPWRMTNPVITKSRRFILSAYQWFLVMEVVYFFLFFMILLGFDDILIQTCNLTDQYIQQLGKGNLLDFFLTHFVTYINCMYIECCNVSFLHSSILIQQFELINSKSSIDTHQINPESLSLRMYEFHIFSKI